MNLIAQAFGLATACVAFCTALVKLVCTVVEVTSKIRGRSGGKEDEPRNQ